MNIFYLDRDPALAARYHCDKHVIKMILETGQLLSTAHRLLTSEETRQVYVRRGNPIKFKGECLVGRVSLKPYALQYLPGDKIITKMNTEILIETRFYRKTHENHPCAIWVRASRGNYLWTYSLLENLCEEYTHRYGKVHKMQGSGLLYALADEPTRIAHTSITPPPLAMPDEYKDVNPVQAYRNYYLGEKKRMLAYTNRDQPTWAII